MKELFVTDLDGTFINSNAKVSDISAEIISDFTKNGNFFTFATARTASSAVEIMKNVNINAPCILMNGVSIYNIKEKKYIKNEYFSKDAALRTCEIFKKHGVIPFLYNIENEVLYTYYCGFNCKEMKDFFEMRGQMKDRPFRECNALADAAGEKPFTFPYRAHRKIFYLLQKSLINIMIQAMLFTEMSITRIYGF